MTDVLTYNQLLAGGRRISRRGFIKEVSAAAAGAALLALGGQLLANGERQPVPGHTLAREAFSPYVGHTFHVQLAAADALAIELFKVRDLLSARMLAAKGQTLDPEQNFSLVFRGPADRPLIQNVYRFEHARLGAFELLIVPLQPDHDTRYYETIFNRLRG